MPITSASIGTRTPEVTVAIERGQLRLFAKATGQSDPVYTDELAARAQGHPDVLVPPTFLFGLDLVRPDPFGWITDLGVDMNSVLHGSQGFEYEALAHAGDTLTALSTITDVYSKRGGRLQFIERRTDVTRAGDPVATLRQTLVITDAA